MEEVRESIKRLLEELEENKIKKYKIISDLISEIELFFTFEIDIIYQPSDGWLILDIEDANVYTFECIKKFSYNKKLTKKECFDFTL